MSVMLCAGATFVKEKLLSSCQNSFIRYCKIAKFNIFEQGIFSFNTHVYYLTRAFIVSIRAFNLLTRTFNLPNRAFNFATCAFSLLTRGFKLVTRGFELVTPGFQFAKNLTKIVFDLRVHL